MLVKIAKDFEIFLKDIVCIINLNKKEDKINKDFITKNTDLIKLCDEGYRSLVIVRKNNRNILYLSPYSAMAISKKKLLFDNALLKNQIL